MTELFQSISVGVHTACIEMRAHKMRSFLSMLGVMLGVASLVAMLTLIGGIDVYLNRKMAKWMGSVWIWKRGQPQENQKLIWNRSPGMRFSDGGYLENNSEVVKRFVRKIERRGDILIDDVADRATVRGVEPLAIEAEMEHVELDRGRWLSNDDFAMGRKNCVVSWEIEERISRRKRDAGVRDNDFDVLGATLTFRNVRFTIVGIYRPKDPDFKPWHLRRCVFIPLEAMRRFVTGVDPDPGTLEIVVSDFKALKEVVGSIGLVLQERHRGVEDFEMRTADWFEQMSSMLNNVSLLMGVISAISLVVGGMSIMNVMLSSIAERIREIGTRKALGAKNLQIFIQFIAETTTLCFSGGVMGAAIGLTPLAFTDAIQKATEGVIEPTILPSHVVYVFSVIACVGVAFGLYPAIKASRMNAIDALRYE